MTAFNKAWEIGKKSWDGRDDDYGWTDNVWQCRACGYVMSPDEWEMKRCPECGTRNTVHPSMR